MVQSAGDENWVGKQYYPGCFFVEYEATWRQTVLWRKARHAISKHYKGRVLTRVSMLELNTDTDKFCFRAALNQLTGGQSGQSNNQAEQAIVQGSGNSAPTVNQGQAGEGLVCILFACNLKHTSLLLRGTVVCEA
jgi:hypothetical protein